ncbi:uncharacterized protein LOC118458570 [Anopheles albimanus]|uniref:Uncharacterized protein n=1 Tax=Anopheles albimanus TaxID=7167 RepID=A0A182F0R3_ANOAL|nr:uncharacterized protein LOC118458570 [Anopheles albimanus]
MKLLVASVVICALVASSSAQTTKSPSIFQIQQAVGVILGQMSIIPNAVKQVIAGTNAQNNIYTALDAISTVKTQYTYFSSTYTSVNNAITNFRTALTDLESNLKQVPVDPTKLASSLSTVESTFMYVGSIVYTL